MLAQGESSAHSRTAVNRATAAGVASVLEIAIFYPFDTVAKRLMSYRSAIVEKSYSATVINLNNIIFRSKRDAGMWQKFVHLYPGSAYAVWYKILQRVYKLAGQPIVREHLKLNFSQSFDNTFGRRSRLMMEATAGSIVGAGEVLLLPLDRLKVLSQTNEGALSRGVVALLKSEGVRGMYSGAMITIGRNVPGTFCLFGGAAFTKEFIFLLEDFNKASFFQNMCASAVGASVSVVLTNPMDVLKTRVQNKDPGLELTALGVLRDLMREEGCAALMKGVTPKVLMTTPKLMFAYSMTELLFQLMNAEKR
ncbi:unnamed protein product [Trypanosoma congolense IL3000]|uniref:WGS project CAEQ00000000 data, annotated contig 1379 n=1 Tax=Trypanosoma congolense (strain IL3000) TaxID=1068625 RepID=F9W5U6_TRYCI|nr:unnamed protein product [Trypanosoma congolense IL3000]